MRIRKRSGHGQSASTVAPPPPPSISCKYQQQQQRRERDLVRPQLPAPAGVKVECSNMQEEAPRQRLDAAADHDELEPQSSSDVYAEEPLAMENLRLSDAHDVEDGDLSGSLEEKVTDKLGRRRKPSPSKRRKIEHESSLLFEGTSSMTAAELLAVNELANGVRQRLAASEQSTSETATKSTPPAKPAENSKDALISSIFYIFDTCGDNGLSASEVVKTMLEQRLPGLKEGGARHTVQVANVLRSSSSFISLGDKKYLLCSTLDESASKKPSKKPQTSPPSNSSSDDDDRQTLNLKPRRKPSRSSAKKVEAPKPPAAVAAAAPEKPGVSSDSEPVVRIARRRGPSSSQKGKGPTQCKRYDGRGWQCSRLTEPGYSLCVHHQDLINKRAAKLKEQQTLSRLMESVTRKTKPPADTPEPENPAPEPENGTNTSLKLKIVLSRDREQKDKDQRDSTSSAAPVQKRKMLSLLAIK